MQIRNSYITIHVHGVIRSTYRYPFFQFYNCANCTRIHVSVVYKLNL